MDYQIRLVRPDEVPLAMDLALRVFMEFEAPVYGEQGTRQFVQDCVENDVFQEAFISGRSMMLGAFYGSKMVGMIAERAIKDPSKIEAQDHRLPDVPTDPGHRHIAMVFVDKEYHRQGIASALMTRMMALFYEKGVERVTLNSSPYGLPFYHRFGFYSTDKEQEKDGIIYTPVEYQIEFWDVLDENGEKTGKTVLRSRKNTMGENEFMLAVHVFIHNSDNQWLIQKRSELKRGMPNIWEITGGAVVTGEDSLTAALREVKEEIGIDLDPDKMKVAERVRGKRYLIDLWVAEADFDLADCVMQPGEVDDLKWVSGAEILALVNQASYRDDFYKEAVRRIFEYK